MQPIPLRTTVIGSYPFPSWLIFASEHIEQFGPTDIVEMQEDAVSIAVKDQIAAGLDVITDGNKLASTLTYHSTPLLKESIWRFVRTSLGTACS